MSDRRIRREPPPFEVVHVVAREQRASHLVRVTVGGAALEGFDPGLPAASVRLLLPDPATGEVVVPTWNGNEFLDADGGRPPIRTLTPLRFDAAADRLDVEVVLHDDAPLSRWATSAEPGSPVALSGPGRGVEIPADATDVVLAGDESAVPALATLLGAVPAGARVTVLVEHRDGVEVVALPAPPGAEVRCVGLAPDGTRPGDALVPAVEAAIAAHPPTPGTWVFAAGEAAAVQRIRRHLFDEVGLGRSQAVVRGYWKVGRAEAGS